MLRIAPSPFSKIVFALAVIICQFGAQVLPAVADVPAAPAPANGQCAPDEAKVVGLDLVRQPAEPASAPIDKEMPIAKLGDTIRLKIEKLASLLGESTCRGADSGPIVLFIDGRPVPSGIAYPPLAPESNALQFVLARTDKSRDLWAQVLGGPVPGFREVGVSVGLEKRYPLESSVRLKIDPLPWNRLLTWGALFGLFLLIFCYFAVVSDVLRAGAIAPLEGRRPYSLSRFQAAWWFFTVLWAYLFISIATMDFLTTVNGASVWILAIAAGTAAFSTYIDAQKNTDEKEIQAAHAAGALDSQITANGASQEAQKKIMRSNAAPAQKQAAQTLLAHVTEKAVTLKSKRNKAAGRSEGWLTDILSDAQGVSFHRFQLLAWTVVLGVVFVYEVWHNLAMPQFGPELLGLLGLSSGTYLGVKIPEPTVPKTGPDPERPDQPVK